MRRDRGLRAKNGYKDGGLRERSKNKGLRER